MRTIVIIAVFKLIVSCDPPYILIVENHSEYNINFEVNTREPISFDSIFYSDTLISDDLIKLNTIPKFFNEKLKIEKHDSLNYYFTLKPKNEILISPSTIGMPFNSVTYIINGVSFEIIGESKRLNENLEIKNKPLRTTIVKIK